MSDSGRQIGDFFDEEPMATAEKFWPSEKRLAELLQENIDLKLQLAQRIAQDIELQQARDTNRRLNRRCQAAESQFEAAIRQALHSARYVASAGAMLQLNLNQLRSLRREAFRQVSQTRLPEWVLVQRLEEERKRYGDIISREQKRTREAEADFLAAKAAYAELEQEVARLKRDAIYEPLYDATQAEVDCLREAIRKHMNMRGDDRCYSDDHDLYTVLPEQDTRPERETLVTIENCAAYIACRQQGREYSSPQRRIEELEQEVLRLRTELLSKLYSVPLTLLDPDRQLLREFEAML